MTQALEVSERRSEARGAVRVRSEQETQQLSGDGRRCSELGAAAIQRRAKEGSAGEQGGTYRRQRHGERDGRGRTAATHFDPGYSNGDDSLGSLVTGGGFQREVLGCSCGPRNRKCGACPGGITGPFST